MNINTKLLTRNLNALIHKYNQLAIECGKPTYMRTLLPTNTQVNEAMLRFEYGLVLRKLKRLLSQEDNTGGSDGDDNRVQSIDTGVTIDAFKDDTDGITVGMWTYVYDSTALIVVAQYAGIAEGELELKLSDMPAEVCTFTGGESLSVDMISFSGLVNLTKLTLHEWDLGDINDMSHMFEGCSYMTTIDGIQDWDTSKVKKLNNTFSGCKELTALDLSKWNTSLVTDTTNMMLGCDKLESLTINSSVYNTLMSATNLGIDLDNWYYLSTSVGSTNSWSELGVEDETATIVSYPTTFLRYDGSFESLSTEIVSGPFKYSFTTDITGDGQVFNAQLTDTVAMAPPIDAPYMSIQDNNKTLVPVASFKAIFNDSVMENTIDVSKYETRKVNDMSSAFYNCRGLEKINGLDKWNTSKVEDMSHMFSNMDELTTLNGIQNWDTSKVKDMSHMFELLRKPNNISYFPYISSWDTSSLLTASSIFAGASGINALMLNSWVASEDLDITNMFKDMRCLHALTVTESMFNRIRNSNDSGITFTDWYYGLTKIGTQTWSDLGLSTPAATFTKYAQNEKKLDGEFNYANTSIVIDKWRYTGFTYDRSEKWQYLAVEYLDKADSEIPTEKPYTSIRASDNTALTVDNTNTMFRNMKSLTTVDMSSWSDYMLQVVIISNLFAGCTSLTSVNVTGLYHTNMIDASFMFTDCTSLTEIIGLDTWMMGTGMRSLNGFFNSCSSLTQINGISSWNITSVTEMLIMFSGCSRLESLDLSGWELSNTTVITGIFSGCNSLTSIQLKQSASRLLTELPGNITDWYIRLPDSYAQLANTDWNDEEWGTETPRIFYKGGPSIHTLDGDFPTNGTSTTIDGWTYTYTGANEYTAHVEPLSVTAIPSDMPYNYFKNSSEQTASVNFRELCAGCALLTDVSNLVDLPVRYINALNGMFTGCISLKTITSTANWDVRSVGSFISMFATGNTNTPSILEIVDLSGWDLTTQNHDLTNMFDGCVKLKSVKISKTGAKILTVLPGNITDWKVNGTPLTDTNWNTSWGDGPVEFTRDVA